METKNAIEALAALAHEGRLDIFRALVRAGPEGLAAGKLGEQVGLAGSTLSNNLATLTRSGLIASRRDGRSIIYTTDFEQMTGLLAFLMEDCCGGSPSVCAPLSGVLSKANCCATANQRPA